MSIYRITSISEMFSKRLEKNLTNINKEIKEMKEEIKEMKEQIGIGFAHVIGIIQNR